MYGAVCGTAAHCSGWAVYGAVCGGARTHGDQVLYADGAVEGDGEDEQKDGQHRHLLSHHRRVTHDGPESLGTHVRCRTVPCHIISYHITPHSTSSHRTTSHHIIASHHVTSRRTRRTRLGNETKRTTETRCIKERGMSRKEKRKEYK